MSKLGWKDEGNYLDRVFHQRVSSFSIGEEGERPLVRANILVDEVFDLIEFPEAGAFYVDFVVSGVGDFREWFNVGVVGPFSTLQDAKREAIRLLRRRLCEDVVQREIRQIQEMKESPLLRFRVIRNAVDGLLDSALCLQRAAKILSEFEEEA